MTLLPLAALLVSLFIAMIPSANGQETHSATAAPGLWALLKGGGQVLLIRHGSTDAGAGDPPGFRLDDCSTQRNLSAKGRDEARRIAEAFRDRGIPLGDVHSSQWCRCLETAQLAFGRAEPWPALNLTARDRSQQIEYMQAVRARMTEPPARDNTVLVTHQLNIHALTGISLEPAEIVVLTPEGDGRFRVAGRISVDALR